MMDAKGNARLMPPAVKNFSCSHPRYDGHVIESIGANEMIQASFIVFLTFIIVSANLTVIVIINSRKYQPFLHPQVKTFYHYKYSD